MSNSRRMTFQTGNLNGWSLRLQTNSDDGYDALLEMPCALRETRSYSVGFRARPGERGYDEMHAAYTAGRGVDVARMVELAHWMLRYNGTSDIEAILSQYLVTALWSSRDGEHALDQDYGPDDVAPLTVSAMRADILRFVWQAGALIDGIEPSDIGHDFWLTRNHHGVGFWDRGLGERGDRLTEIADSFGECELCVGDDGWIHMEGVCTQCTMLHTRDDGRCERHGKRVTCPQ